MDNVINVDWAAVRAQREQKTQRAQAQQQAANLMRMTQSQACMLKLAEMRMSPEEYHTLSVALSNYDAYNQSSADVQLLVDIYQMLEAF